jgi:hypothetical protein
MVPFHGINRLFETRFPRDREIILSAEVKLHHHEMHRRPILRLDNTLSQPIPLDKLGLSRLAVFDKFLDRFLLSLTWMSPL